MRVNRKTTPIVPLTLTISNDFAKRAARIQKAAFTGFFRLFLLDGMFLWQNCIEF